MRVQLTAAATITVKGAGAVMLKEASVIGDQAGDYPVAQIENFAVTAFMVGIDAAGTSAVTTAGGPRYSRRPPQSDGSLLPPTWPDPRPAYQGGPGPNWAAA